MARKTLPPELLARVKNTRIGTPYCDAALTRLDQVYRGSVLGALANLLLVGETGTGKTALLEIFRERHPPSRTAAGIVRPLLFAETPANPTPISLMERLLKALGDPRPTHGTAGTKSMRIATLIEGQGVLLLLLDDLQHMVDKKTDFAVYEAADCLKEIVTTSKISLIGAGLYDAITVVRSNEQLIRRHLSPIVMPRFDWADHKSRECFAGLLKGFRLNLPELDMPELESAEMAFRIYLSSGGLVGLVANLLQQVVWDAVDKQTSIIRLDDFAIAHTKAAFDGDDQYNPFLPRLDLAKGVEDRVATAKKIAARVPRPRRGSPPTPNIRLAQVGL